MKTLLRCLSWVILVLLTAESLEAESRRSESVLAARAALAPTEVPASGFAPSALLPMRHPRANDGAGTPFVAAKLSPQATGTISGTVTGTNSQPLAGASVSVQGTARGAVTGADGRYTITAVPSGSHTVRASYAGYAEGTRAVTVMDGQSVTANFQLTLQAVQLEAIVAIGYGTARRRDLTGSVASVSAEDAIVKAAPTAAVATALQGRAAGVQVVSTSGAPGAGVSVRVRGSNSITANSEPLYIVDGLPVAQGSSGNANPLASIDPSDIESIDVLKDAASTSIYGARGANGVVLITTRRGTRGGNTIQVETSYGIQQPTNLVDVLNGPQFMQLVNEANLNSGRAPAYTAQQIAEAQTYDYVDAVLRDAPQRSHSATVSGGDAQTRYLVGANYSEQQGIVRGTDFNRYGFRLNLDREVSGKFRVGNSLSLTYVQEHSPGGDNIVADAMQYYPFVPFRDANGDWIRDLGLSGAGFSGINPLATVTDFVDDRKQWRGIGNVFAEYDFTDSLRLRSSFGGNFGFSRNASYAPSNISQGNSSNGVASVNSARFIELTNENLVTYRRELGPGNLDLLGGMSVQTATTTTESASGANFPSDALEFNNIGVSTVQQTVGSNLSEWTLLSYLARANYNLLDRYLFTVTARQDGSSRFGENNKWAFFPSAAFAWRVVDEPILQDQTLFSDLKFRLSYGRTGNQAIDEYQSLARLQTNFYGLGVPAGENVAITTAAAAPNPDLKWETQDQANLGLDMGFFDNRLTISADLYQSTTSDLLLVVPLVKTTGYTSQLQNVGSVRNRGVELAINSTNYEGEFFSWRTTLNLARNRNQVRALRQGVTEIFPNQPNIQGLEGFSSSVVRVGQPLGLIIGFETDGLYQQGDPCPIRAAVQCTPGEYRYADINGDSVINLDDRTVLGQGDPDVYGGFNSNMVFGPLSLDAFFNFSYGNEIANLPLLFSGSAKALANERTEVLNRWTPTNTRTDIPRANNARPGRLVSSMVENGSYLRLQALTLGYRLPDLLSAVGSARLYLTGQNLWLRTNYSGFDPEVSSRGGSSALRGIDTGAYPRSRVWNLGAEITF